MTHTAEITLSFFNTRVAIRSDDPRHLDLFARLYPRFVSASTNEPANALRFSVFSNFDNIFGVPALVMGDEVHPLEEPIPLLKFHSYVMHEIQQRVDTHFLVHAGVVSRHEKGILLVGDANFGKSTLVLTLLKRGFTFLSDELAAISRVDGKVYPYPRYLGIRPETLKHLGLKIPNTTNDDFDSYPFNIGKHLINVESLFPGRLGSPVPIRAICILSDPKIMPEAPGTSTLRLIHLWVGPYPAAFLSELTRLNGVSNLVTNNESDPALITLTATDKVGTMDQARSLCARHGVTLVGISDRMGHKPAFDVPPRLSAISHSQATRYLFQRFLGGREALLRATPTGRPAQLFAELMELIGGAACYTLSVGPLTRMTDLIDEIAG